MLTDSAIVLPCLAPPRSFAALMTLYESNYVRMRAVLPELLEPGSHRRDRVSHVPDDLSLYVSVRETSRYTITLHMTYFFVEDPAPVAEPDLYVRVYRDARMAEAMACGAQHRHSLFGCCSPGRQSELERRWSRNVMLNKWLEYCADRGHRIGPARAMDAPAVAL